MNNTGHFFSKHLNGKKNQNHNEFNTHTHTHAERLRYTPRLKVHKTQKMCTSKDYF